LVASQAHLHAQRHIQSQGDAGGASDQPAEVRLKFTKRPLQSSSGANSTGSANRKRTLSPSPSGSPTRPGALDDEENGTTSPAPSISNKRKKKLHPMFTPSAGSLYTPLCSLCTPLHALKYSQRNEQSFEEFIVKLIYRRCACCRGQARQAEF
jgi:hypothetical protein